VIAHYEAAAFAHRHDALQQLLAFWPGGVRHFWR
jgi:hypothetical protein